MTITIVAAAFLIWVVLGGIVAMTVYPLLTEAGDGKQSSQDPEPDTGPAPSDRSAVDSPLAGAVHRLPPSPLA